MDFCRTKPPKLLVKPPAGSPQCGRGAPVFAPINGLLDLPADDGHEQLIFSSACRYFAREAADVAAVLPVLAAVRADAELAVAVEAVEGVGGRPGQARAEGRIARAPGLPAVGGDERALLGRHGPVVGVVRVDDDVDRQ